MNKIDLLKSLILYLSLFIFILSCEKYSTGKDDYEIFNTNFENIYGDWISYQTCGGWTGGCSHYYGDTLRINEYCDFELTDNQGKYALGKVNIISQDSINLRIKLDRKQGNMCLFSNDELYVTFRSYDTIVLDEGCCDRWAFVFVRKE